MGSHSWRCSDCSRIVACASRPRNCPNAAVHVAGGSDAFDRLDGRPVPDFLIAPAACRAQGCGGDMVASREDLLNDIPVMRCSTCRWTWFARPQDVADLVRRLRGLGTEVPHLK